MSTVSFLILLAAAVMILCYATVIYRTFVAQKFSGRYYKNILLALLCFGVYVTNLASVLSGFLCQDILSSPEPKLDQARIFMNETIAGIIVGICLYAVALWLSKSILKDYEIEKNRPEPRWVKGNIRIIK